MTIIFGFLSLSMSNFNPTVYFGIFTALAMTMAILSSLVLLPALPLNLNHWENNFMGPLTGTKIVEFAGLGPGPFCGMILADMGAEVIVIDQIENYGKEKTNDLASRGKKSIAIDLKNPNSKELVNELIKKCRCCA